MKKLKIGFAAIVALVAIGLTIAAQAGAFETKKTLAEADCFDIRTSATVSVKIAPQCPTNATPLSSNLTCTDDFDGAAIFSLNPAAVVSSPADNCPGGEVLCCVQVVRQAALCPNQPTFDIGAGGQTYAVDFIRCFDE